MTHDTLNPVRTDDPRAVFGRAVALGTSVIAAIRPDQLGDPTPCPEYDVGRLLGHLVTVLHRVAALGRGDDPFAAPTGEATLDAWTAAAHGVQDAWTDDAVLTRTMRLPWLEAPGAAMLTSYLNEVTVHTWDLAAATGQRPAWDRQIVSLAYDAARLFPATGRAAIFERVRATMPAPLRDAPAPFADAVPVAEDASLIDRLVAWSGRDPSWAC